MTEEPKDIEGEGTKEPPEEERPVTGSEGPAVAPESASVSEEGPIDPERRALLRKLGIAGGSVLSFVLLNRLFCSGGTEESPARTPPRSIPPRRSPPRPQITGPAPVRHREYTPETVNFDVNIDRLREGIIRNGVLVLTHNGLRGGQVGYGENEFYRIVQKQEGSDSLGRNTRVWPRVVKKECSPRIIDEYGQLQNTEPNVDVYVVDGTQGVQNAITKEELQRILGGKKFGLILVAGHVYDIEKLLELSKAVRADESYTLMGGCRTADFIPAHFEPNHILAGSVHGIGTEAYTHFTRMSMGALLGRQFNSWEEYFRIMGRYSDHTNDHILPGHPQYWRYLNRQARY